MLRNQKIRMNRTARSAPFAILFVVGTFSSVAQQSSTDNSAIIQVPNLQYTTAQIQPRNSPPKKQPGTPTGLSGARTNAGYAPGTETIICGILPGCRPAAPVLESALPFSNLTPGGYVLLFGKHFYSIAGTAGNKLRFRVGTKVHDLVDLQWTDTTVGGKVTDDWNYNAKEDVDLWVERADGAKSNVLMPRPTFSPTYDIQSLRQADIHIDNIQGADENLCDLDTHDAIGCYHITHYGNDAGTDHFSSVRLWNNWVLFDIKPRIYHSYSGIVDPPSGFQAGATVLDLSIHWDQGKALHFYSATECMTIYDIDILIQGPKGYDWNPQYPAGAR